MHATQQAQPAVEAAVCSEPSAVTSFSESEILPVQRPKKKKVRFYKVVDVVLIPTRKEYEEIKLNQELWWNDDDYLQFKASAMEEYIRHMQKKQLRQERREQREALEAAALQQKLDMPVAPEVEEQSPEQRRAMKHVDSIVLTQSQQIPVTVAVPQPQDEDAATDAAVDELFLSDCHTDGSTEASSVDEHDDPDQPISDCGSSDLDEQQPLPQQQKHDAGKQFCGQDGGDSPDLIHHFDSLELQRTSSSGRKAPVAGFEELEEFLRHHAASYEWRCILHSQRAVMI